MDPEYHTSPARSEATALGLLGPFGTTDLFA